MVTGDARFRWSHLCEKLLSTGSHVICEGNFYTGQKEYIAHLSGDSKNSRVALCLRLICHAKQLILYP
jgi:UDP-glucose 4-epimerase